jgi:hypothetical protein
MTRAANDAMCRTWCSVAGSAPARSALALALIACDLDEPASASAPPPAPADPTVPPGHAPAPATAADLGAQRLGFSALLGVEPGFGSKYTA